MPTRAPPDLALIKDLAEHAAQEAMQKILEIMNRLPEDAYKVTATAVCFALLQWRIEAICREMEKVTPGFAGIVSATKEQLNDGNDAAFAEFATASRKDHGFQP
jgi:hypothetical protein